MGARPADRQGKKSLSGRFGTEAKVARALGVSVRRFYGWEPRRTTRHFDAKGNLTGWSVTETEPEWDADERAYMVASTLLEEDMGPHGVPMSLATDKAIQGRVSTELVIDYVARDVEMTRKKFEKDYDHQDKSGWRFVASLAPEV